VRAALASLPARVASLPILAYRYGISPVIGPRCRFFPTCSEYGLQALRRFGAVRGSWLIAARLARCHPWHPGGVEPLPDSFDDASPARYLGRVLRRAPQGPAASPDSPCPCEPPRLTRDGAAPPFRS
jgi:putative membrane protein insertion efficiency factor